MFQTEPGRDAVQALEAKNQPQGHRQIGPNRWGGVVLAAGLSSRMGNFKPLLKIHGISMIRRVVHMMRRAGCSPIVVVTGHRAKEVKAHLQYHREPVLFVYNKAFADTQQLDSLKLGLAALEGLADRVLLSPSDIPLVSDKTVKQIQQAQAPFVRPVCRGRPGHPAALDMQLLPYLMTYEGPDGLRGAVQNGNISLAEIPVEDEAILMDNDTPQDFCRSKEWYRKHRRTLA